MGSFLRGRFGIDNEQGFVQGAGRIIMAPGGTPWPEGLEDLLLLTAGATQYDPVAPWVDAGFTKTGINITRNNGEDNYDVDQVKGDIKRRPNNWEMSVGTQLAEATLETFALAWELSDPVLVTKVSPQLNERHQGLGAPTSYTERLIAVLFQFDSGLIRSWCFRRCIRAAQESGMTLNKTGEQVSLPMRWTCLTDPDQTTDTQFGEMFEQVAAP